jgi:hypothetical protein
MAKNGGEESRMQGASRFSETSRVAPTQERRSSGTESNIAAHRSEGNGVVVQYPFSAVTTCFAIGVAVGMVGGLLLIESRTPRWYERVPDAYGRRWLESLLNALPESVRAKVA